MELNIEIDHEETVLTDPESEEVDETFYMNRLLMLGTVGALSASPHSNPVSSYDNGVSPLIEVLPSRGLKRPCENQQVDDSLLVHSARRDAVYKDDDNSTNVDHITDALAPRKKTPKNQRTSTKNVCNGQNAGPLRRSLRTSSKSYTEESEGKEETGGSKSYVTKGTRKHRQKRKDTSSKRDMSRKNVVLAHSSRWGQQRPGNELNSSQGFCGIAIKNQKTGKVLRVSSIHRRNQFGETQLHIAVLKQDVHSVNDMIRVGACVNLPDNAGWTPLHEAVLHNNYIIAETLLEAGAQVNPAGYNGVTPLHDAVHLGNLEVTDLLLRHGADPLLTNEKGEAAIDINKDMSVQNLLRKYVPTTQTQCLSDQSVSITSSCVESEHEEPRREPCKKARQSAEYDEATTSQQTSEIGASVAGEAEEVHDSSIDRDGSSKVSSAQTAPLQEGQAKDVVITGSLLAHHGCLQVPDPQHLVSDTSSSMASDGESDVTVDYIEAYSSSPGYWFLSATQDFSGSLHRLLGEIARKDANTIDKDIQASQSLVSAANESNPSRSKGLLRVITDNTAKMSLDGFRDHHKAVAKKRIRRIAVANKNNTFLDYLLNFDLNSVCMASSSNVAKRESDGSASPLNSSICKNHLSEPAVCQKDACASQTSSNSHEACSISLHTPCLNKIDVSNVEGQTVMDSGRQSLRAVMHSPLPSTGCLESTESGSPSLLIGMIHDQGLTCSPESQVRQNLLRQSEVTDEHLKNIYSSSQASSIVTAQSYFDEGKQKQTSLPLLNLVSGSVKMDNTSEWSQTNIDTVNNLTSREMLSSSQETIISTVLSYGKHSKSDKLDTPTKQVQQREDNGDTQFSCSQAPASPFETGGIVSNKRQDDGKSGLRFVETTPNGFLEFQAIASDKKKECLVSPTSSKNPRDNQTNANTNRNAPDVSTFEPSSSLAQVDSADMEENQDSKGSTDSDCTVIEEMEPLKTTDKDKENVVFQLHQNAVPVAFICGNEQFSEQHGLYKAPDERGIGQQLENPADPLDTGTSVSMLRDLAQKPLCLLPTPDNNQGSESVQEHNLQIAVENEGVLYTDQLSQHQKKTRISKLQKKSLKPKLSKHNNTVDAVAKRCLKITPRMFYHRNCVGETYLHQACKKGDLPLVKKLINAGMSINISDNAGWTALHEACAAGHVDVVEQLLHAGADINRKGLDGVTPLHDAVFCGQYEVVKLLLGYGSNPHDKNALGKTALDLADHESIKELLLTFKGPLVVPKQVAESSKQGSDCLPHGQILQDSRVCKPPPSALCPKENTKKHKNKKDTSGGSVFSKERLLPLSLQEVEQKQTEMSVWGLNDPEDRERFTDALLEMQTVLNNVFCKQHAERLHLSKKYRTAPDTFRAGQLSKSLLDFASHQKYLLMLQQKQNELKHKLKMSTDQHCSSTVFSTEISLLNTAQHSQPSTDQKGEDYIMCDHNYTTTIHSDLESQSIISNIACPSLVSGRPATTDDSRMLSGQIRKEVIQPGDNALEVALMDSCHKASVSHDGPLRDTRGKAFSVLEHRVAHGLKTHWTCSAESNSENGQPQLQELASELTCTRSAPEGLWTKEKINSINSIHLIRDEEFLPCYMMDRYWHLFIESEDWVF